MRVCVYIYVVVDFGWVFGLVVCCKVFESVGYLANVGLELREIIIGCGLDCIMIGVLSANCNLYIFPNAVYFTDTFCQSQCPPNTQTRTFAALFRIRIQFKISVTPKVYRINCAQCV